MSLRRLLWMLYFELAVLLVAAAAIVAGIVFLIDGDYIDSLLFLGGSRVLGEWAEARWREHVRRGWYGWR